MESRYSDSGSGSFGKVGCIKYRSSKNQRKEWIRQKVDEFIIKIAVVQQNCQEETANSENPLQGGSEDLSGEIQGESGESQPAEPTDDAEARADFWSIQGDFICRHHNEPRVQLHVPKEETFPVLLKLYIDVTRSTHTDLVLQNKGLTIIGMSTRKEVCQILGKDSHN